MTKAFYALRLKSHPMHAPLLLVLYATSPPRDAENCPFSSPHAYPSGTPVVRQAHQRQHPLGLLAGYSRLHGLCCPTAAGTNPRITRTQVSACLLPHLLARRLLSVYINASGQHCQAAPQGHQTWPEVGKITGSSQPRLRELSRCACEACWTGHDLAGNLRRRGEFAPETREIPVVHYKVDN
jgi:hypothetical protein